MPSIFIILTSNFCIEIQKMTESNPIKIFLSSSINTFGEILIQETANPIPILNSL